MELSVRYRCPNCQSNGRAGRTKRRKSPRFSPDGRFAPKAALGGLEIQLPLYPRKQTQLGNRGMSVVGNFRTCRDFRVESAFGGKAEVGFRARQGQLLAQSGRLARSEVICVVWSGLPGHWIDSLDSGIGHSIPSFSEIIRGIAMQRYSRIRTGR